MGPRASTYESRVCVPTTLERDIPNLLVAVAGVLGWYSQAPREEQVTGRATSSIVVATTVVVRASGTLL